MTTHTGTGTRAGLPGWVTAAALAGQLRVALADESETTWTAAQLLAFINEAIREYSVHLPRQSEAVITAVDGVRRYGLPWDTTDVTSVEYPAGQSPATYLHRLGYRHRRFTSAGRLYDVWGAPDQPALVLSFDPEPGATLRVRYRHPHAHDLAAEDEVTVPRAHHYVLVQYGLFAAARQLQAAEQANPTSSSSLLMSQLASNTRRLELAYLNALNRILTAGLGEAAVVAW